MASIRPHSFLPSTGLNCGVKGTAVALVCEGCMHRVEHTTGDVSGSGCTRPGFSWFSLSKSGTCAWWPLRASIRFPIPFFSFLSFPFMFSANNFFLSLFLWFWCFHVIRLQARRGGLPFYSFYLKVWFIHGIEEKLEKPLKLLRALHFIFYFIFEIYDVILVTFWTLYDGVYEVSSGQIGIFR